MRYIIILLILITAIPLSQAQFVNNGGTVTVQAGATLRVETDFTNTSGTINNLGLIEVLGHFSNAAGSGTTLSGSGELRFIGTANSNITTNGDALNHVEMAKTTSTGKLTLLDNTTINGNLEFTGTGNNKIEAGNFNLTLSATSVVSATTNHPTNGYVVTNGTGRFIKGITANGTKTFEIGDATNYTPLSCAVTGSTYSSATLGARVVDATHPNKPSEADSYLSRYWDIAANGITGYSNTMTGTYASSGDINGTASRIKGASYSLSAWVFTGATTNGSSTVTGSTLQNTVDFTGINALNKVDLTVYLSGPLSGSSMTNTLQVYDPPYIPTLLPITSQYGAPTTTYSDIGNPGGVAGNVTDWVKVEIRDGTNPATILETRSLLLKTNGHIVDPSGSVPFFKDYTANVRFTIHHRNHLAVLGNSVTGPFEGKNTSYNFSTSQTQAVKLDPGDPDQLQLKNGLYCMRPGDINGDFEVNGSDLTSVKASFSIGTYDVYTGADINCDGTVDGIDLTTEKLSFSLGLFSTLINL